MGAVIEAVEQQSKPFVFVVNAAIPRTRIALDAVRALAQHGKVAPATLHNRIDFATSMVDGRTARELNEKSRSSGEVAELRNCCPTLISSYVRASGGNDMTENRPALDAYLATVE
ncbi:MAG: hypothetical protein OXQ89_09050 [Rhodospirillaceae bacterium]|nr:hypothetical protein [Rhodospirillaceae bacterium]